MNNTEELEFSYRICRALDQRSEILPASIAERLALARKTALSHKKAWVRAAAPALAAGAPAGSHSFGGQNAWLARLGVAAPLLAGLALFIGLYQYEQQSHIDEIADLDAAVLSDELPLAAYADHGFNAFLAKRGD